MIKRINPESLHETPGYHHITVVEAGRLAFLAGQCPLAKDGSIAEGIEAQVDQIAANALAALAAVDATPDQVVRSTIYVASDDRSVLAGVWQRLNESPIAAAFTTASTLLGVAQLGFPGQLVELDLTAALPAAAG